MKTWFWKEKCLHKERWTDYIPTDSFMSTKITGTFLLYSQMSTVGKPTQLLGDSSQKKRSALLNTTAKHDFSDLISLWKKYIMLDMSRWKENIYKTPAQKNKQSVWKKLSIKYFPSYCAMRTTVYIACFLQLLI